MTLNKIYKRTTPNIQRIHNTRRVVKTLEASVFTSTDYKYKIPVSFDTELTFTDPEYIFVSRVKRETVWEGTLYNILESNVKHLIIKGADIPGASSTIIEESIGNSLSNEFPIIPIIPCIKWNKAYAAEEKV